MLKRFSFAGAVARTGMAFLLVAGLAGCASDRAIPEFHLYAATYEATSETVNAVLDEFEAVERERVQNQFAKTGTTPLRLNDLEPVDVAKAMDDGAKRVRDNGGYFDGFFVADSIYFASDATPPTTAAFRRAFRAVGAYNEALAALAEGRSVDQIAGQFGGLLTQVNGLAETIGLGAGILSSVAPGGALATAGLNLIKSAIEAGSKEAFRDAAKDLQPIVSKTLTEMRDAAPPMFDLMSSRARSAAKEAAFAGNETERDAQVEIIENYRVVMSNWVVSLDATDRALKQVVAAIDAPTTPASILGDLTTATQNAAAIVNQTRQALGAIRTAR